MSKVDHYVMPDQKKGETSAYVEVDDREKAPNAEQKKWEEEHLALRLEMQFVLYFNISDSYSCREGNCLPNQFQGDIW